MSDRDEKTRQWEQRYQDCECLFGEQPSELLSELLAGEPALISQYQSALAVADGEGRNGLWLARQGLRVTTLEQSREATDTARTRAEKYGLKADIHCIDLFDWHWPGAGFDMIACIFLHLPPQQKQRLYSLIDHALKPGGLVAFEGYRKEQITMNSGGPRDPALLYDREGLQQAFSDYETVLINETFTDVMVGGEYRGKGAVLHMIARKPD